jgi:hypothetical protein
MLPFSLVPFHVEEFRVSSTSLRIVSFQCFYNSHEANISFSIAKDSERERESLQCIAMRHARNHFSMVPHTQQIQKIFTSFFCFCCLLFSKRACPHTPLPLFLFFSFSLARLFMKEKPLSLSSSSLGSRSCYFSSLSRLLCLFFLSLGLLLCSFSVLCVCVCGTEMRKFVLIEILTHFRGNGCFRSYSSSPLPLSSHTHVYVCIH